MFGAKYMHSVSTTLNQQIQMKTFLHKLWALAAGALLACSLLGSQPVHARPGDRVSFQVFYDHLSPHGRWINDSEYGYVWAPRVEPDFQPYASRGHWVMTEYGNTWVSDYDWGWAPFHYGRWIYDDYDGWLWIPGSDWGPAWVDWRHSDGYYGWAPMGPRVTYVVPVTRWVFVPVRYIASPRIYSYCVPRTRVVNIYHHTTIINNYYERDNRKYVYGPRNQDIERATNRKVTVHRVANDSRPGRTAIADNSVRIYRPEVESRRREREAPAQAETRDRAVDRTTLSETSDGSGRRRERNTSLGETRSSEEPRTWPATRDRPAGRSADVAPSPRPRTRETAVDNGSTEGQPRERVRETYSSPAAGGETARPGYESRPARTRTSEATESPRPTRSTEPASPRREGGYSPREQGSSVSPPAPAVRSRSEGAPAPTPRSTESSPSSGGRRTRN